MDADLTSLIIVSCLAESSMLTSSMQTFSLWSEDFVQTNSVFQLSQKARLLPNATPGIALLKKKMVSDMHHPAAPVIWCGCDCAWSAAATSGACR